MSNFVTKIPVEVDRVRAMLPNGAYFEGAVWNGREIELRWSHHRLLTPYSFHVEFPLSSLKDKQLPAGVQERLDPPVATPAAEPTKPDAPVMTGKPKAVPPKRPGKAKE